MKIKEKSIVISREEINIIKSIEYINSNCIDSKNNYIIRLEILKIIENDLNKICTDSLFLLSNAIKFSLDPHGINNSTIPKDILTKTSFIASELHLKNKGYELGISLSKEEFFHVHKIAYMHLLKIYFMNGSIIENMIENTRFVKT